MKINIDQVRDLESKVSHLYDIKTLENVDLAKTKGFAFMCGSSANTLTKTNAPTLYSDLKNKFDNCESSLVWNDRWNSDNKSNFVYYQGYYYYVYGGSRNWSLRLYRTNSINSAGTDISGQIDGRKGITQLLLYDKYIIGFDNVGDGGIFFVYNLDTNTFHNFGSDLGIRGSQLSIVEDKLICRKYNGWVLDLQYIWEENLSQYIVNFSEDSGKLLATHKIGNTYYNVNGWGTLCSGSTFSNCSTELASTTEGIIVEKDNKCFFIGRDDTYIYQDTTQLEHYSHRLEDIIGGNNGYYSCVSGDNIFMWNGSSSKTIAISTDNGQTWSNYTSVVFPTLTDNWKKFSDVNNNLMCFMQIDDDSFDIYTTELAKTQKSVVINGNTIYYFQNGSFKFVDTANTTDATLNSVYSFLGYLDFWKIVTTSGSESVTLPRNSNLYTMIFVGDDYQESSIPSGNINKKANVLYGTSAPTTSTVGTIGDIYIDTTNVAIYILAGISGDTYTWKQVSVVA